MDTWQEFMDKVLARAQKMATFSPTAMRAVKCALLGGNERKCFESVWGKKDWQEGINNLFAKKTAVFGSDERGGEGCNFNRCIRTDSIAGKLRYSLRR